MAAATRIENIFFILYLSGTHQCICEGTTAWSLAQCQAAYDGNPCWRPPRSWSLVGRPPFWASFPRSVPITWTQGSTYNAKR
jgi:hypothetical protein